MPCVASSEPFRFSGMRALFCNSCRLERMEHVNHSVVRVRYSVTVLFRNSFRLDRMEHVHHSVLRVRYSVTVFG